MDHTDFLSSLPAATRQELLEKSNGPALLALMGHMGLIIGLAALIWLRIPFWPLLMLPMGIALVFTFTLQHECTHNTPFANPWLNKIVGVTTGVILIQPFEWFRYFHLAHHKYTNNPDYDPELQGPPKPQSWKALIWHLIGLGYWASKARTLLGNAFRLITAEYAPPRSHHRMRREARVMLEIYGFALVVSVFLSPILLWIWLIPLALGFPFLRLYLLAEHGGCPHVPDMFRNTRTVFTTRLMRFLAWNMPYHVEHHVYPNVPYHRLADLHVLIQEHLEVTSPGYINFSREYVTDFTQPE